MITTYSAGWKMGEKKKGRKADNAPLSRKQARNTVQTETGRGKKDPDCDLVPRRKTGVGGRDRIGNSPIISPDLDSERWLKFRPGIVRRSPTIPVSSPCHPSLDCTLNGRNHPETLPDSK